jgi:hypothetical protein
MLFKMVFISRPPDQPDPNGVPFYKISGLTVIQRLNRYPEGSGGHLGRCLK